MQVARERERERLQALRSLYILDTAPEAAFDTATAMCASMLDVPIALITFVDTDRQWFKSRVGLQVPELARSVGFCDHTIAGGGPMIVEDAAKDPRFARDPTVLESRPVRFYAAVPLRTADGFKVGTLCAIDFEPRSFGAREIGLLTGVARQVEIELELRRQVYMLRHQLARCATERGEQDLVSAMLAHDLRNPLTAIALSAVAGVEDAALAQSCLQEIAAATERAQRMLSDVLDLCLSRTGQVTLRRRPVAVLALLESARSAVARYSADRRVELRIEPQEASSSCNVDRDVMARALINLLENALRFSPRDEVVTLGATSSAAGTTISVEDRGPGIPAAARARILEPFVSLDGNAGHYGLGLAFCKIAAEAHGGRLWVEDVTPHGSRFLIHIPAGDAVLPQQ